jgi:uncharacterized membrane protein YesL
MAGLFICIQASKKLFTAVFKKAFPESNSFFLSFAVQGAILPQAWQRRKS